MMRWIMRLLHHDEGVALVMVLAFMALAIPVVTAALGLASTLSIDSRVKTNITKDQFSAIGADEYVLDLLDDPLYRDEDTDGDGTPDLWEDEDGDGLPDGDEIEIPLNDEDVVIEITPDHPAPLTPPSGDGLQVTKIIISTDPDPVPANSTETSFVTYAITIANTGSNGPIELKSVFDGLPQDFEYKGPSYLCTGPDTSSCEEINDPSESESVTITPEEAALYFDEGDETQGVRKMLAWHLYEEMEVILQEGESVAVRFTSEFENIDEGYYCNYAWVEPEGSETRTYMTARLTAGNPAPGTCVGEDVFIASTAEAELNPDEDPADPNDDVLITYNVRVENTGATDLNIWWIRDKLPPGFDVKMGSVTGDITQTNPYVTTIYGRQRLNWFFLSPYILLPAQSSKTLIFEALAPRAAGLYRNEVWFFFEEYDDEDAVYSWPSSTVLLADVYDVKVNGEPTSQVWVVDGQTIVRRSYIDR